MFWIGTFENYVPCESCLVRTLKAIVIVGTQRTEDDCNLRRQYEQSGKLQLKQLSLCAVEFTERFLWVQNLDLSHNQLRSAHGIVSYTSLLICDGPLNIHDF